ncbi:DMT family transporter [Solibacillus isronensis]|uniref:DMT family transporter n=1 Tax=Solibacillus isronensis TaxID=412383 RepID=UPI0009A7B5E7|nr:DMT family transporter [Solibacillus isronensis]
MKSIIQFILSMAIFGTIGLVVRYIDLAASERALLSSSIGCLFLLFIFKLMKKRMTWTVIKKNAIILIFSSVALAGNWVFLYGSYDYTTIANATLGYYFAPIFVMILAPYILKELLVKKKIICIIIAIFGLILIVGEGVQASNTNDLLGICFGLTAALFYAALLLLNKFIKNLDKLECTILQLGLAAFLLMPYVFITEGFDVLSVSRNSVPYILILGIVNTGIGFWLFFTGMKNLNGQSIAMLSYVDPFVAIFISAILLHEQMTAIQILGGALLLGSTLMSELKIECLFKQRVKTTM